MQLHPTAEPRLECYGADYALLQPAPDDDPRYILTDQGRRALAEDRVFGPWPTVAEVNASAQR